MARKKAAPDARMSAVKNLTEALLAAQAKGEPTSGIIKALGALTKDIPPPKPPLHSGRVTPKVRALRDAHIQKLYREGTPLRLIQGVKSEWSSAKGYHLYEILKALDKMPDREEIRRRNLTARVVDIGHAREPEMREQETAKIQGEIELEPETVHIIWSMRRQGVVPAAIARHLRLSQSEVDSVLQSKSEKKNKG